MACYLYNGIKYTEEDLVKLLQSQQPKTRRILELQSDLFQKGRDKENLHKFYDNKFKIEEYEGKFRILNSEDKYKWEYLPQKFDTKEEAKEYALNLRGTNSVQKNQFLQLLNKDNNWVTFFVKSIIQDSAKKGYEKVLFPSGNTASKIEGHTTLEEFKKQKEDRIKELENKLKEISTDEFFNKTYKIVDNQIHKKESTKEYPNLAFTTKVYFQVL